MPEIPELEHVAGVLRERLVGRRIAQVEVSRPIVIRLPRQEFEDGLRGAALTEVRRSGKFLLFDWDRETTMAVAPMLTGRFQWTADAKPHARTCFTLHFESKNKSGGGDLAIRYIDERFLGKVYLTPAELLDTVPVLGEQGPDALDAALTEEVFLERLRRYRGQVKNVLVNAKFIAGIGNAYVDEILFEAGVHPFTPVKDLSPERRSALYRAIGEVLRWASARAAEEMGERIDRKPRDFLRVHRKGGEPCPRCAAPISEVSPNRRITSFCRACQPR